MDSKEFKTPQQIYACCPELTDIKTRLEESVVEKEKLNKNNQASYKPGDPGSRPPKTFYPEHFAITEFYKDGSWQATAATPKFGGDAFETALVQICERRQPQGFRIQLYPGKRADRVVHEFTCFLTPDAKKENTTTAGLGSFEQALSEVREQIIKLTTDLPAKTSGDNSLGLIQADFNAQLTKLAHKSEIDELKRNHAALIKEKQEEIASLQDQIEDLEFQLAESDRELGTTAEIINAKVAKPPIQVVLAAALEEAAVNLVLHRPKILTDMFKLKPEQVMEIFASTEQQPKLESPANEQAATFEKVVDEYAGYDAEHAETLRYVRDFIFSLNKAQFFLFSSVIGFMITEDAALIEENAKQLRGYIEVLIENATATAKAKLEEEEKNKQ